MHVHKAHSSHLSGDSQHISESDAEIATNNTVSTNPWDLPQQLTSLYTPKPRLIIIGAGNDVIPVAIPQRGVLSAITVPGMVDA